MHFETLLALLAEKELDLTAKLTVTMHTIEISEHTTENKVVMTLVASTCDDFVKLRIDTEKCFCKYESQYNDLHIAVKHVINALQLMK